MQGRHSLRPKALTCHCQKPSVAITKGRPPLPIAKAQASVPLPRPQRCRYQAYPEALVGAIAQGALRAINQGALPCHYLRRGALLPLPGALQVTTRIGLLGASVTQHPEFDKLLDYLMAPEREHVRLSISSVRTGTVTETLAAALTARGTNSLTIAVESGSERVRRIINKKLEQEEIFAAVRNAAAGGLQGLKLYGMVGIPGETEEDLEATVQMFRELKAEAPKLRLTFGCSTFVPKAHTPFQWYGVERGADKKLQKLEKQLRPMGIQFRPESYKWSLVQAVLARGDRRMTDVLLTCRSYGDNYTSFKRAFKDHKGELPALEEYIHRDLDPGASMLPWSHLKGPLPEETLVRHANEAAALM
ncbi:hypothetical protein CYMTET_19330 [Cymbomonas tetramitiformis]|uniref:Radical SAM core domain-containing protein n=1 Tax=Cymbomonas tetramitiformis TaxID=36881 RepID=A0AAE0G6S9_9CHLO|nr:hypothetical protein CYMTET_19330 [Cymbomonas tetramitiformis]